MTLLATKTFRADLVAEYSAVARVTNLGEHFNEMRLYRGGDKGCIIWNYGRKAADEDETEIGLQFEGNKVTDYDGVFCLPREAQELLTEAGYDITEVCND